MFDILLIVFCSVFFKGFDLSMIFVKKNRHFAAKKCKIDVKTFAASPENNVFTSKKNVKHWS